jgi:hypothetical protein
LRQQSGSYGICRSSGVLSSHPLAVGVRGATAERLRSVNDGVPDAGAADIRRGRLARRTTTAMRANGPSLDEEISQRTGLSLNAVAAVLEQALVHQLDRFRRGPLYTFDAATLEDLRTISKASGQPSAVVQAVLMVIGDVAIDWIPEHIVGGEA